MASVAVVVVIVVVAIFAVIPVVAAIAVEAAHRACWRDKDSDTICNHRGQPVRNTVSASKSFGILGVSPFADIHHTAPHAGIRFCPSVLSKLLFVALYFRGVILGLRTKDLQFS